MALLSDQNQSVISKHCIVSRLQLQCFFCFFLLARQTARDVPTHSIPVKSSSSINTSSAAGGRRDEAVSTSGNTTTLSPDKALPREITDTSAGWEASFPLPSSSLTLPSRVLISCLPLSLSLSLALVHRLPRAAALLRGHPSKFLQRGPAAFNCGTKMTKKKKKYVRGQRRDGDHAN